MRSSVREAAFAFVLRAIDEGMEFPDAEIKAFEKFAVPTAQIRADYDTYCLRAFDEMENSGGGFASALANAWHRADSGNRIIIEKGWPHLIKRYGA